LKEHEKFVRDSNVYIFGVMTLNAQAT